MRYTAIFALALCLAATFSSEVSGDIYQSAEEGDSFAQFKLADAYGSGYPKELRIRKDSEKRLYWLTKAAESGFADAQHLLSVHHTFNTENYYEAFRWEKRAAEQGHLYAQASLASMYAKGRGVSQSAQEAFEWSMRAAERGHWGAAGWIAFMYFKGDGVPENFLRAYAWAIVVKAHSQWPPPIEEVIEPLGEKFTTEQLIQAQELAVEIEKMIEKGMQKRTEQIRESSRLNMLKLEQWGLISD